MQVTFFLNINDDYYLLPEQTMICCILMKIPCDAKPNFTLSIAMRFPKASGYIVFQLKLYATVHCTIKCSLCMGKLTFECLKQK